MSESFLRFLTLLPGPQRLTADARFREAFEARLGEVHRAFGQWGFDEDTFLSYLAARLPDGDPTISLASLNVPDLYLACACSHGQQDAIRAFEGRYFDIIDETQRKFGNLPQDMEDVRQRLRERLFVGNSESAAPAILEYNGQGALRAWFRVVVLRLFINISSRELRQEPIEEEFFGAMADPGADPELRLITAKCRVEFKQAFAQAMGTLTDRERAILRFAFVDAMTADGLGAVYGVHRATAARWLSKARSRLIGCVYETLRVRLELNQRAVNSLVRAAISGIDTTIASYFRDASSHRTDGKD